MARGLGQIYRSVNPTDHAGAFANHKLLLKHQKKNGGGDVSRRSLASVNMFSRYWLRGAQEASRYITQYTGVPPSQAPWRCSGHSRSLEPLFFRGIAFRLAEASRYNGNPHLFLVGSKQKKTLHAAE